MAIVGALLAFAAPAQADVQPITNYGAYPAALPAGCTADGSNILIGVSFSSAGQTSSNLQSLPIKAGDTVIMTWSSFAPGCEAVGIGLSIKTSPDVVFVPTDNQYVVAWGYCGPEGPLCAAPFSLSLSIPAANVVPCWQLDAHVGPPLAVVGPNGAFYSFNQPKSYLISSHNDGTPPCVHQTCPTAPQIPASAWLCEPPPKETTTTTSTTTTTTTTTTTAPPPVTVPITTTTTTAPVCADNPALPASSPDCKPKPKCAGNQVVDPVTGACVVISRQEIPVTGFRGQLLLMIGGLLLAAGGGLRLVGGRRRSVA